MFSEETLEGEKEIQSKISMLTDVYRQGPSQETCEVNLLVGLMDSRILPLSDFVGEFPTVPRSSHTRTRSSVNPLSPSYPFRSLLPAFSPATVTNALTAPETR